MKEGPSRHSRQPFSVRTLVISLILATLLPLLAFSAYLVLRSARHEQELLATLTHDRARTMARDLEQELSNLRARLFVIADAAPESPDMLAQLRARALAVLAPDAQPFVLSQPDGADVLDTRFPPGARLPANPDPAAVRRVVASGEPVVSNLVIDPTDHEPWVAINVPVIGHGKVLYVASLNVAPILTPMLKNQHWPPGWVAAIADANGVTLARNFEATKYVGQRGRPAFLRRLIGRTEGWFPMTTRDGVPAYFAFSRVEPVGWTVIVAIPRDVLFAPVHRSTQALLLTGTVMVALAVVLAMLIGRRISAPITGLLRDADALGRGAAMPLHPTGLRETDVLARSLHQAGEDLRRHEAERAQAAAALLASEQRKQVLQQAVLAQEAERTRIARELHDSLGQYMTALQLGLNAIARQCAGNDPATDELIGLRGLTSRIGREINRIAWELRPTALDDLGLETAITQYLEEWSERTGLQFELHFNLGDRRLPQVIETTVYRALQEAVTNVVRHAEAQSIAIILRTVGKQIHMIVEDDGKGFPDAIANGDLGSAHLGLLGIRERLALVDGTLDIESTPGRGTALFVRVPL